MRKILLRSTHPGKAKRVLAALGLLLMLVSCLHSRDVEFPLFQSMSYFPYSENSLLAKGEFSLTSDSYYSNIYMYNHWRSTLNDFETFSSTIALRYGIMAGGTLELYFRHSFIFGGVLDKAIDTFHDLLNLPDTSRYSYPRFKVHYKLYDYFFYKSSQNAASPVVLAFLKNIHQSPAFSLKARAALGIPLSAKPGFSSGKPFFSAGLVGLYRIKHFSLEGSAYLAYAKTPSWMAGEDIRPLTFYSQLEARWKRVIAGFIFRTSVFKEDDIAHRAYQLYLGYQVLNNLEFIIMEDLSPFDVTPDICFNIRLKLL
jgi:hypothetical protein